VEIWRVPQADVVELVLGGMGLGDMGLDKVNLYVGFGEFLFDLQAMKVLPVKHFAAGTLGNLVIFGLC